MVNDINQQYYQKNAQTFFASTVDVDMQSLYDRFLPLVPAGGSILDAGCGAGRDSKAFLQLGFTVEAFDASEKLACLASQLLGQKVLVNTFQNYHTAQKFDAIWACASLLHVPLLELPTVFAKLGQFLQIGGVLYCSFKYGEDEIARNGRVFSNLTETSFTKIVAGLPFVIEQTWQTGDLRAGRENELWLNTILRKI